MATKTAPAANSRVANSGKRPSGAKPSIVNLKVATAEANAPASSIGMPQLSGSGTVSVGSGAATQALSNHNNAINTTVTTEIAATQTRRPSHQSAEPIGG